MKQFGFALHFLLIVALTVTPTTFLLSRPVVAQEARETATITELANAVEARTARLVTSVRRSDAEDLKPDSETGKPVWASLKTLNEASTALANGAALKNDDFHKALGDMVSRTAATATAIELTEVKDPAVDEAKDLLIDTVGAMQERFSKHAARQEKGGELSDAERAEFEKIRANQAELQKRLKAMEAKVKDNKRAMEGLKEAQRRSRQITNSGSNVGDFLAALVALRIMDGLLWGCHWWWGPWGVWYPSYSISIIEIHDDIITDIEYDWDVYGTLDADVGDLDLDASFDADELTEAESVLDETDIDLSDGLDDSVLAGLSDVTGEDLMDPDLGLSEITDDAIEEGLDSGISLEPDVGSIVDDTADLEVPEVVTDPVPEIDLSDAPDDYVDDSDLNDLGSGFDDGGLDDFGGGMDFGGMDDLGGGFDY